jgi:hypothetical protein
MELKESAAIEVPQKTGAVEIREGMIPPATEQGHCVPA